MNLKKYKSMSILVVIFLVTTIVVALRWGTKECFNILKEHRNVEKNTKYKIEDSYIINPIMNEDTLWKLKEYCKARSVDFSRVVAMTLMLNEFDLSMLEIDNIDLSEYSQIYMDIKTDKENSEVNKYLKLIESVLRDAECFPIGSDLKEYNGQNERAVKDNGLTDREYPYSFENTFGSPRNYDGKYLHEGTDIMVGKNVSGVYPIVSVSDGVVENVGWLPKGGYRVGIRGDNGTYFYYAHLHEGSITVNVGDTIEAGEIVGYMGDTGYGEEGTKGKFPVHLHFGIYIRTEQIDELAINPYYILKCLERSN